MSLKGEEMTSGINEANRYPIAPATPAAPSEASEPVTTAIPQDDPTHGPMMNSEAHRRQEDCTYTHDPNMVICMKCGWTPPPSEPAPASEPAANKTTQSGIEAETDSSLELAKRIFDEAADFDYDDNLHFDIEAAAEVIRKATPASVKREEVELKLRQSHHLCCNYRERQVGECNCVAVMKADAESLSRLRTELEQAQGRVAELQNKKCAHDAAREWSTNTTPNFEEQPNAH